MPCQPGWYSVSGHKQSTEWATAPLQPLTVVPCLVSTQYTSEKMQTPFRCIRYSDLHQATHRNPVTARSGFYRADGCLAACNLQRGTRLKLLTLQAACVREVHANALRANFQAQALMFQVTTVGEDDGISTVLSFRYYMGTLKDFDMNFGRLQKS